ncbi:MAG: acyltransferase [Sphingobacteriia bacterium]|nr:acyltransferase [Sphingobacteriia bacterium]NCC40050.1 acyltransferase [Gammaproteobacteria bacterium]
MTSNSPALGAVAGTRMHQILNVQGLRALAVLLVVFLHLRDLERVHRVDALLPVWADIGHSGVDLFFVISGFIMVVIAREQSATMRTAARFLYHRWARIYPAYWFWFLVTLAIYLTAPAWLRLSPNQLDQLVASFFLIPTWTAQLVPVSWTLKYELYFYLVFSVIILLPPGWRARVLLLWGVYLLLGQAVCYEAPDILCHKTWFLTMHPLAFEFLFGAAVAWLYLHQRIAHPVRILALGLLMFAGGLTFFIWSGIHLDANIWYRVLLFGLPAAVLLWGLVEMERQDALLMPTWLVAIGNASYSIYLSHLVLIELLFRALSKQDGIPTVAATPLVCMLALGIGILAYQRVERPLLALTRGRHGALVPWRRFTGPRSPS